MRILFVDPGERLGVACFDWADGTPILVDTMELDAGHNTASLLSLLDDQQPGLIVAENYRVRPSGPSRSERPITIELIGVLRAWCQAHQVDLEFQEPSMRKFANRAKLEYLGWCRPGQPHAQDALRHALTWFVRKGQFRLELANFARERIDRE